MRIQAGALVVYGILFGLVPEFMTEEVFGWDAVDPGWIRASGVPFLILAWVSWLVSDRIHANLDMALPFVALPTTYVVLFLTERAAGVYRGTEGFWWINVVVAGVFAAAMLMARISIDD